MTERLGEVEQHLDSVTQLSSVVSAIRGIAAARLREADERLKGITSYAATIAEAISQALLLAPSGVGYARSAKANSTHTRLILAMCSEQGFVGGFNGHVLGEVERMLANGGRTRLAIVGDRGLAGAQERGMAVAWSAPMAAHAEEVTTLANRLAENLYADIQSEGVTRVLLVHPAPGRGAVSTVTRTLLPFDFARFPPANRRFAPLLNLPPQALLASLAEEYVFAEICEAVMLSYAAENQARMMAMTTAHENVGHKLDELTALSRRLRQEEITAEVVELSAGVEAGIAGGRRA